MSDWKSVLLPQILTSEKISYMRTFGPIYEHSAWVAEAVWPHVHASEIENFGSLALAMAKTVADASDEAKCALLCAHPELASRAALAGELTDVSNREQSGAGLDRCSPAELERIQSLNDGYREKFGFPFIIAVSGLTREGIIGAMSTRIANSREVEFAEALRQVDRIAEIRLAALVGFPKEFNQ